MDIAVFPEILSHAISSSRVLATLRELVCPVAILGKVKNGLVSIDWWVGHSGNGGTSHTRIVIHGLLCSVPSFQLLLSVNQHIF